MIARAGSGWQTVLADLSIILFMVTASAVQQSPAIPANPAVVPAGQATPAARIALPSLSEPVAVWREAAGGPDLNTWLAAQPVDQRQRLTLVADPVDSAHVLGLAAKASRPARVLIEPGLSAPPYAALTYDSAPLTGDIK